MQKRKLFAGAAVRRLREAQGLAQQELARRLRISTSYLNQIEHNQRPVTASVLVELSRVFRVDVSAFSDSESDRLLADVRDVLADPALAGEKVGLLEMKALAQQAPSVARALVRLYGEHRSLADRYSSLDDALATREGGEAQAVNFPYDEVRDYFHGIGNYVDPLDRAAEDLARRLDHTTYDNAERFARALEQRHGIAVEIRRTPAPDRPIRQFDRAGRRLLIDGLADRATQAFAMAYQIALLEVADIIDHEATAAGFRSPDAKAVCSVALANHFAGALMLPYARFAEAARKNRHDIGLLAAVFGASVEQICHRFSTLQRPGAEGLPFYFLRVDRAGNITKRHSATRFQFARYGGACPLWNVHEAFETPDRMLVQIAEMPDGVRYLSMAQGLTKSRASDAAAHRRYAIGIGCELAYADQVIYADALDWRAPKRVTPIGVSCRLCERESCPQRAFPPVGHRVSINNDVRREVPYAITTGIA